MPLSEYEQRVLEQMERQLSSDDPKLVNTFQARSASGLRRWLLVSVGTLVGLTVLVVGAVIGNPLVGVLGFVVMFVSIVLAFSAPRRRGGKGGPVGIVGDGGTVRRPEPGRGPAQSGGFMQRMEERWDRRREDPGR